MGRSTSAVARHRSSPVEQHDRRASLCHAESNGASDATARAGHNADAILETKPIGILLRHDLLASAVALISAMRRGSTTIVTVCCDRGGNCSADTGRRPGDQSPRLFLQNLSPVL